MTMEEIEYRTPNGLHDACLLAQSIDYKERTLTFSINFFVGEGESVYKRGTLTIHNLEYCVMEAPEAKNPMGRTSPFYGFPTGADEIQRCGLPDVPSGTFRHSLYMHDWTSFIHFAGTDAEVVPTDLIVRDKSV